MKLVTRTDWGGPAVINVPHIPVRQGMAVHYNGPETGLDAKPHAACYTYWLGTHNYHVNTNGWSAIGYAWGVCPHGYVFEGRGFDCDQAAQGDPGNQTHQAVQFMIGGVEKPSPLMLQAWYDLRFNLRGRGVGAEIRPHSSFLSTFCPGGIMRGLINDGTLAVIAPVTPVPAPEEQPVYTVKAGDTLWGIAQTFKTTVTKLESWNKLTTTLITVGQKLRVLAPPPAETPKTATEPAHDYTHVTYSGRTVNIRTRTMLNRAAAILGKTSLTLSQGSYTSSNPLSAGTHDGGGVVDVASSSWTVAKALRQVGFCAWVRTPSEGQWPYHIHCVAIGDRQMSPSAHNQVVSYFNGRNALASNLADTAPTWVGRPYPDWAVKYR